MTTETEDLNNWLLAMERQPLGNEARSRMEIIRHDIKAAGLTIIRSTPSGWRRNEALTNLQAALMWANTAACTPEQENLFDD